MQGRFRHFPTWLEKRSFESEPEGSSPRVEDGAGGPTTELSDKASFISVLPL